jgi:uncharacterized membrane protein
MTFNERPAGQPPALRAWFYPGSSWGDEFVYPKKEARELAQSNKANVPYSNNEENSSEVTQPIQAPSKDETARMQNEKVGAYNAKGEDQQLAQAVPSPMPAANPQTATPPAQSFKPAQTVNEVAQNTPPANSAPAPATHNTAETNELPQTAGNTGLLMLGGLFALGGALSIRYALRHA